MFYQAHLRNGWGFIINSLAVGLASGPRKGSRWLKLEDMTNELLLERVSVEPNICHGKPCIRGLRYPVEFLLEMLSGDMSWDQILADYPDLESVDLHAACAFGRVSVASKVSNRLLHEVSGGRAAAAPPVPWSIIPNMD
jgi:uncharacterized protein (DUF433 family)